jgi:hypothetical protein
MFLSKDGKIAFYISSVILLASGFLGPVLAQAETQKPTPQRVPLRGQVPAAASKLQPLGRLDGATALKLSVTLPLHNQDALKNLLQQIYDPASPLYRHYLSADEFDARFGPTEQDYQDVIAWANRSGFTITTQHASRMLLQVTAKVADIERALQVTMRTYAHPTEHRTFFAPDSQPSLDAKLPILDIDGLSNFERPHPANMRRTPVKPSSKHTFSTIGSGPNGILSGFDYRAAYAPGVTNMGSGQTVGLLEFDGYFPNDIVSYKNQAGVPNVPVVKVLLDGFNGTPTPPDQSGANGEVALDIEMAISMAPQLSSVVVFEAGESGSAIDIMESMSSATYTNIKQFSSSWTFGIGSGAADSYFIKLAAQGQSFFQAVGDYGANTESNPVSAPDDDEYITIVGGTALGTAGPRSAWLSETVWNAGDGPDGYASSGGISPNYLIPYWQKGVSMSANHGSSRYRNYPDVAMVADNIFIVADDGTNENTGGTSAAAPLWAAFTALVNQQAATAGVPSVGFLNPAIYNIGTNSGYTACFDDVTFGENTNDDITQFFAVPGFDLCTGWGGPTGSSLIVALTKPDGFQITPGRGAVANGAVGGPFSVTSQTFTLSNTTATAFNWSRGSVPDWLNVSSTGGTLASGGTASVTLSLNSAANALAAGVYSANLWFTNLTSGLAQNRQFTLQVSQELVLDGGFEAGDFCYWTLSGDSSIYTNNFVDSGYYTGYSPYTGDYFAALGQAGDLAYLSQPLATSANQLYVLSYYLQNANGATPNQFQVQWNTNTTSANIIFNQTDMGTFAYDNYQFVVAASGPTTLKFGFRNDVDFFCLDNVSVMPVPVPSFQAPTAVGGSLQLSWPSFPGVSYQVQSTGSLALGNWTAVGSVITATGNSTSTSESIGSGTQFYRVVVSP